MLYHCKLNLPTPISKITFYRLLENKRNNIEGHYLTDTVQPGGYLHLSTNQEILHSDLLKIFKNLKLTPNAIITYGSVDRINYLDSKLDHTIHSDIVYHDDTWKKQPFAINWETTDTQTDFHWWDVGDTLECYPPADEPVRLQDPKWLYTRGIHYNNRNSFDILPHYKVIENCVITKAYPVAVNTSVPHSVIRKINNQPRCGVSIRFPLDQIPTWTHGLKLFNEYI